VTTHCFPNVLISHPPSPNYHPSWQHQYYLDIHSKFCIVQLQIGFSHSIKIHWKFPSVIWSGLYNFKSKLYDFGVVPYKIPPILKEMLWWIFMLGKGLGQGPYGNQAHAKEEHSTTS